MSTNTATVGTHDHSHDHNHNDNDHHHGSEPGAEIDQAASASVALDIGAGRGALVLYPSEQYRNREIEISLLHGDGRRVHTGVHERATHTGTILTAIFGSLAAGDYQVWADATTLGPVVTVSEASVAEMPLA